MTDVASSDSVVTLTENAASQVKAMLAENPENQGKILRVYVESGGCSGMQYGLVFDEERAGDIRVEHFGVPVVVDSFSAEYLRGSKVDFIDGLTGGGFKVSNPNARHSYGCGKSFEA
jgi:iron-sulfur cluster assembly protein/iron-sulfur cluster insertion protein